MKATAAEPGATGPGGDCSTHGSAPKPESTVARYGFIDALRGFALLGVLVHHVVPRVDGLPRVVKQIAAAGGEGVQLFFVVSALTLFLSFDSRRGTQARPLTAFFLRRFFRIAPLFYLAAVFYLWYDARWPDAARPSAAAILATLGFVHVWHPDWANRVVPGGWSIGVEMEFYLLVPLLYARIRRAETAVTAALVSLLAGGLLSTVVAAGLPRVLGTDPRAAGLFSWYWLPAQMPVFFLGITLYFLVRKRLRSPSAGRDPGRIRGRVLLTTAAYLLAAATISDLHLYLGHALFGVAFVLAGWGLSLCPSPVLVNRVTRGIGTISFSAYITHFAALDLAEGGLALAGTAGLSPLAALGMLLATTLGLTVAASLITYRLIEIPGQQLGRWFIAWSERRRLPAAGSAHPAAAGAGRPGTRPPSAPPDSSLQPEERDLDATKAGRAR
ncbi:acyltransferase [Gemmata sp. G18]|uniref:Acyltransferase n=1 Tax=Gemmata palustris TaxID=2822762 RepID=A0ABS5BXS3_9BACT|nr:acyltransferase [Gemmata palustris]MBP3957673.1 acyltransferase [Gemmata palustris]